MENAYVISPSPHIFAGLTTSRIMRHVLLALIPAACASIYFFKARAAMLIITASASCIITELAFQKIRKRPVAVSDGSALVTGVLLALTLPPSIPFWIAITGGVVAIAFGKQVFGGLGRNIFNPALVGRAFLLIAFPAFMTSWSSPGSLEAVTGATPLGLMKFEHIETPLAALFLGNTAGSLGETSSLCIIIGGLYLILTGCMGWRVPAAFLGSVAVSGFIFNQINPAAFPTAPFHLFSGGLMLGAVFMATDPVTTPITKRGRWVFGAGCGIILIIIRLFGGMPEGVTFSILIMNAAAPLINMLTMPRRFGT